MKLLDKIRRKLEEGEAFMGRNITLRQKKSLSGAGDSLRVAEQNKGNGSTFTDYLRK